MKPLTLEQISIRDVRNLRCVDLSLAPSFNIVFGDNGQGKTSLLEAMYLASTTRSFRTSRVREVIGHNAVAASVRALVRSDSQTREQFVSFSASDRVVRFDSQKVSSISSFVLHAPMVVFHPQEMDLTMGPASLRRRLVDRVALFVDPISHHHALSYDKAMKARKLLLARTGSASKGLEVYEQLMAKHGCALSAHRERASVPLINLTKTVFAEIGPRLDLQLQLSSNTPETEEALAQRLHADRARDISRPSPALGPHRDDLVLQLDGHPVRLVASQGQHRLLTLALKIAELSCVAQATGVEPILLLDDVSSELDVHRAKALFRALHDRSNQVFLTTSRPDMLRDVRDPTDAVAWFEVVNGAVCQQTTRSCP